MWLWVSSHQLHYIRHQPTFSLISVVINKKGKHQQQLLNHQRVMAISPLNTHSCAVLGSRLKLFVSICWAFWTIFAHNTARLPPALTTEQHCCCSGQKYMADSVCPPRSPPPPPLSPPYPTPYLSIPPCNGVGCKSGTGGSFRSLQFLHFHLQPPDKLSGRCLHRRYFSPMAR